MSELKHRDIKDIIDSMFKLIESKKISGQFAMDLNDLCAFAYRYVDDEVVTLPDGAEVIMIPEITNSGSPFSELEKLVKEDQEAMLEWWKQKHPGLRPLDWEKKNKKL
jgi:hypothetical protein